MDLGGIIAGALGGGAAQAVDIADKQIDFNNKASLQREMSSLEEQKAIRVAEMLQRQKDTAATADRTRNAGYFAGGKTGMAAANAALAAGDVKTATDISDAEAKGGVTVGYGSVAIDRNNKVRYDNASDVRADNDEKRAEARQTLAERKAASAGRTMLPQEAELALKSFYKREEQLQAGIDKGVIEGADPKNVATAQAELTTVRKQRRQVEAKHGLLDPVGAAQQAIEATKGDPTKLAAVIKEAYDLDPTRYGPQFMATVQAAGVLPAKGAATVTPGVTTAPTTTPVSKTSAVVAPAPDVVPPDSPLGQARAQVLAVKLQREQRAALEAERARKQAEAHKAELEAWNREVASRVTREKIGVNR